MDKITFGVLLLAIVGCVIVIAFCYKSNNILKQYAGLALHVTISVLLIFAHYTNPKEMTSPMKITPVSILLTLMILYIARIIFKLNSKFLYTAWLQLVSIIALICSAIAIMMQYFVDESINNDETGTSSPRPTSTPIKPQMNAFGSITTAEPQKKDYIEVSVTCNFKNKDNKTLAIFKGKFRSNNNDHKNFKIVNFLKYFKPLHQKRHTKAHRITFDARSVTWSYKNEEVDARKKVFQLHKSEKDKPKEMVFTAIIGKIYVFPPRPTRIPLNIHRNAPIISQEVKDTKPDEKIYATAQLKFNDETLPKGITLQQFMWDHPDADLNTLSFTIVNEAATEYTFEDDDEATEIIYTDNTTEGESWYS